MTARCDHVVKIPTRFCINVGLAGALVMYDRCLSFGGFAARPTMPGGPSPAMTQHVFGGPKFRTRRTS